MTSLYLAPFYIENFINLFNKTSYLNEEVNGTEPSSSVSIPCPSSERLTADGEASPRDVTAEVVLDPEGVLAGVGRRDVVDCQRRPRIDVLNRFSPSTKFRTNKLGRFSRKKHFEAL